MKSYIDGKYLASYFESFINSDRFSEEEEFRRSILTFIKSKSDLFIDVDLSDIIQNTKSEFRPVISTIINQLTTGRQGTKIQTKAKNKFRCLNNIQIYSKLNDPFNSFWLGETYRHDINKYRGSNPFFFLSKEDDLEQWNRFSKKIDYYISPKEKNSKGNYLNNWGQLFEYSTNLRDIIINDRYCFNDKNGVEANIIPLIKNLIKTSDDVVNILLFTWKDYLFARDPNEVVNFIKNGLVDLGVKNEVGLYCAKNTHHSRFVITNTHLLRSDDSFDYFYLNGTYKTKGTPLSVVPIHEAEKATLNEYIQNSKSIYDGNVEGEFFGTKKKNLLDLF